MAGPLGALGAAYFVATELPKFAGFVQGYATTAWMRSLERSELARANLALPNVFPGFPELLDTFFRGGCTYEELKIGAKWAGVGIGTDEFPFLPGLMWEKYVDCLRPRPPLDVWLRADALGYPLPETLDKAMARLGWRDVEHRLLLTRDSNPLSIDLILQLLARGIISNDDMVHYLRHAGYRDNDIAKLLVQESGGIDPATALILLNRGLLSTPDVDKYQKWAGYRDDQVRQSLNEMRWQWPALTQVMQYAQLGALDAGVADALKLDDEKPDSFYQFARANGQHWSVGDTPPETWPVANLTPAELSWRAHWRPNDVATAIAMLHRLRPDPNNPASSRVPGVPAYTADDFNRDLAANAVPPGRRQQLAAVSYLLPRFTVYRTAYNAGVLPKQEAVERLQDSGFELGTAQLVTNTWEHERTQAQFDKLRPLSLGQIKEAYRLGSLSRERAATGLYLLYLDDYEEVVKFMALPADAQAGQVAGNAFVAIALNSIDADIAGELAKQAVEVIKKAFLRLEIDGQGALSQLVNLGIVFARAQQYVQLWTYEHAAEGVEIKAGELRDWYLNHLIDQYTYTTRLALLGYGTGDIALILARANLDLSERAAKLQAQTIKAQHMEQKQLAAAAKAIQQQQKSIAKAMCSSGTRKQVATWTIKGFITYYDGYTRLQECGMRSDDAVNVLTEAQPKKGGLTREQVEEKITGKPTAGGTTQPVPAQ